eukprot:2871447-Prymnesium_polylepis.2
MVIDQSLFTCYRTAGACEPCGEPCERLAAALITYAAANTAIQLAHGGYGHGSRKIGKRLRITLRVVFFTVLAAVCAPIAAAVPALGSMGIYLVIITLEVAIELWGRGERATSARSSQLAEPTAISSPSGPPATQSNAPLGQTEGARVVRFAMGPQDSEVPMGAAL